MSYDAYLYDLAFQKGEKEKEKNLNHVIEQIMWERDIALETLRELGGELGVKADVIRDKINADAIKYNKIKDVLMDKKTSRIFEHEKLIKIINE